MLTATQSVAMSHTDSRFHEAGAMFFGGKREECVCETGWAQRTCGEHSEGKHEHLLAVCGGKTRCLAERNETACLYLLARPYLCLQLRRVHGERPHLQHAARRQLRQRD